MWRVVFVFVVLAVTSATPTHAKSPRWADGYFPNLPVLTQNGETLNFYDDLIRDKIVVVSFIYTSCPDICPVTTARLAEVQRRLGDAVGRDIFMISLTVDPETDTPERLKTFADAFDAGPGWTFVTGAPEVMKAINHSLGDRSRSLGEHRNEVVLGNDRTGEWARDSTLGELDRLVVEIRAMDPKWRDQIDPLDTDPGFGRAAVIGQLGAEPGRALFKRLCSGCHSLGAGDRAGPDLLGVTDRRDQPWLTQFLMDPMRKREEKDPSLMALIARFPGVRMPYLGLSEGDTMDLIHYLDARSELVRQAREEVAPHQHTHAGHSETKSHH